MAKVDEKLVQHVASLARLELGPAEVTRLVTDLTAILTHVKQLDALDTDDVPATEFVAVESLPFRPDDPQPCLPPEESLRAAPRVLESSFAVPAFVDD